MKHINDWKTFNEGIFSGIKKGVSDIIKTTINEFVNSQDKIKLGDFVSHSKEMPRLVGRVVSWDYENDNYVNVDYDGVIRNQRIDMLFKV